MTNAQLARIVLGVFLTGLLLAVAAGCAPATAETAVDDATTEVRITEKLHRKALLTELRGVTTDPVALALIDSEVAKLTVPDAALAPDPATRAGVPAVGPGVRRVTRVVTYDELDATGKMSTVRRFLWCWERSDGLLVVHINMASEFDPAQLAEFLDRAARPRCIFSTKLQE